VSDRPFIVVNGQGSVNATAASSMPVEPGEIDR
jgi:hypothetical protein